MTKPKRVIILLGPTGVGKTDLSLQLAQRLHTDIISSDSRQIYREIPIGTAAVSLEDRAVVPHHLVGTRSIHEPYSASLFESDACQIINTLHERSDSALVVGGSMMYIDALVKGIDEMPDVDPEVRRSVFTRYEEEGLDGILSELRLLDPAYYERVDRKNYKRVLHGYEMCLSTGLPFSSFHTQSIQERPWEIVKIGLTREREELYERINLRVEQMIDEGLEEEARSVYPYKHLNALNTVGFKELFAHFDGAISREEAIRQIQRNTRIYARKQLTWWRRDESIHWFHPSRQDRIFELLSL